MESQEQSERETWRTIVFGRDGTEVLLRNVDGHFIFPSLEIPRWERLAENLTAALKKEWGCDAVCLFTPNHSSRDGNSSGDRYEVMECWSDDAHTGETLWNPVRSLTADSFHDVEDFRILELCLQQLGQYERDVSSPFAKTGWLASLRDWTADVIRPFSLKLSGVLRQYNASPSFSLIRFETNGPAVWFKAVGEPNLREFAITLRLAELSPKFMPKILGAKPEWNGWLACEVEGTNLGETKDIALWEQAATLLARLQINSISECQSILRSGVRDLRCEGLWAAVDPFFDLMARLMEEQTKVPPAILSPDELSLVKLRIEDALTLLEDLRIPDTLGHLDLNPGNVIVSADGCVFLDWAEGYVGHPFFSFDYLLEHFRRATGGDVALEARLVASYCVPWEQLLSVCVTAEARLYAPLVAVFAYAAGTDGWKDPERLRDPKIVSCLRSLARRMNREAIRSVDRRVYV